MKDLSIGILNELYGSQLTDKQRDIIRSYYDFDLTLSEIAEQYGMSRQAANDAVRKGERALRECERSMGFMAKLAAIKSDMEKLKAELDDGNVETSGAIADRILKNL